MVANHPSLGVTEFQMPPEVQGEESQTNRAVPRNVICGERRPFACLISGANQALVFINAAEELGNEVPLALSS